MLEALIFVVFPFCMAFAAISDMLSMTIANRVSVVLIVAFTIIAPLTGMDWESYGWHFAAFGTVLAVTFVMFTIGGMGGGDAKLMAASALWMGMSFTLIDYLATSAILGGMLTLLILSYRKSPFVELTGHNMFLKHFADSNVGVPYGVALGVGGLITFPESPLMLWAIQRLAGH